MQPWKDERRIWQRLARREIDGLGDLVGVNLKDGERTIVKAFESVRGVKGRALL